MHAVALYYNIVSGKKPSARTFLRRAIIPQSSRFLRIAALGETRRREILVLLLPREISEQRYNRVKHQPAIIYLCGERDLTYKIEHFFERIRLCFWEIYILHGGRYIPRKLRR